ncbi:phytanoyl-CoA dioxygenase [Streptomyces spiroverticillatus]|uniref:Phytanoyl-CoA dioxygenase n=1 Tax=Streptomyces finlayi TaxID=67296 RepID=A0A918X0M9_9ACTN|nr:phytanoyl-CoA dioxygenase family protein [Streptomyces finlayi]GHA37250.1 phytanoyl-CoA dioxygenase [Streptomyces spiroverticillatus]GHD01514.1 phytanoyl-CoA dioxygenase [Streptomyces finlayi]
MSHATAVTAPAHQDLTSNGYTLDPAPHRLGRLAPVPDAERDDLTALRARFNREGYLYLPGFFRPDVVREFRRHYFTETARSGLTREGTDPGDGIAAPDQSGFDRAAFRTALFRGVVPGPEYEALCRRPELVAFYRWFLGAPEVHLHRRKIIRHGLPGESGIGTATQAHYDLVYLREGTERVLSSWIPLGDCPLARGGLVYLERSHHRVRAQEEAGLLRRPASLTADLPSLAEEHDTRWLVTDYAAGDMVVHSPYLVHASLDNRDPDGVMRLSTDIRYQSAADPIDARWQNHWHLDDGL